MMTTGLGEARRGLGFSRAAGRRVVRVARLVVIRALRRERGLGRAVRVGRARVRGRDLF